MYRITRDIALYLMDNSRDFKIPGIDKDKVNPFVIQNRDSIGSINAFMVVGSDSKFIVETDAPEANAINSEVSGFWLYKNSELKTPDDVIEMPRSSLDHYSTDLEEMLNVTDCVVELPSPIEKLTCPSVTTLERLFELEPELKNCLDPEKEKLYARNSK